MEPLHSPRAQQKFLTHTIFFFTALISIALIAPAQSTIAPIQPTSQLPTQPHFTVLIDAAHGGDDTGGKLGNNQLEKSVTLAFSVRLRSLLAARGITVVTTREEDKPLSPTDRAELANRSLPNACISLHAAETGSGIHLFTSSLTPTSAARFAAWKTAQSAYIRQSLTLAGIVNSALTQASINVTLGRTALPGIDSMSCPAIALELAPERDASRKIISETDSVDYQARIAQALAAALLEWKTSQARPEVAQP